MTNLRVKSLQFNGFNGISGPFGHSDFIDRQRGLISPPSHVPHWVMYELNVFIDQMGVFFKLIDQQLNAVSVL